MRRASIAYVAVLAALGCSGGDLPPKEFPTNEEVRDFYGLNPGTCYRFDIPQKQTFGRMEITGPNMQSIAGRTVYDLELFLDTAERPFVWQLEVAGDAEVRLVRGITDSGSNQVTTRFEDTEPPVFAQFEYVPQTKELEFAPPGRYEVDTMPQICPANMETCLEDRPLQKHAWVQIEETTMVPTPDGELEAIQLQYTRTIDNVKQTARYDLVPGRGFARFIDFESVRYNLCAWKTCDSAGNCTVDTPCNELACSN